jgi:hypothetical protein
MSDSKSIWVYYGVWRKVQSYWTPNYLSVTFLGRHSCEKSQENHVGEICFRSSTEPNLPIPCSKILSSNNSQLDTFNIIATWTSFHRHILHVVVQNRMDPTFLLIKLAHPSYTNCPPTRQFFLLLAAVTVIHFDDIKMSSTMNSFCSF